LAATTANDEGGGSSAMALIDDDEAVALQELFAGMDAAEEADAASAMSEAAAFLRKRHLSFRHIVQEIEARDLLLPSKVGAAIQLMDSTTLSEAQGALAGARRLMRSCGLTFARVIGALDDEPADAEEIGRLRLAYQIEVERSREMAAELQFLRANAEGSAEVSSQRASTPFKSFVVVATLVFGIFLAVSIASTIAELLGSANATATQHGAAVARRESVDRPPMSQRNAICWRDRSIHGPCF
jgi:hypothetical protein